MAEQSRADQIRAEHGTRSQDQEPTITITIDRRAQSLICLICWPVLWATKRTPTNEACQNL